ncbi:hypothetical protein DY000_02058140 [Brassica cretica]|uniref:Uncharacterized protein n=1 Tax=Brassica cretica TaxID=69181 RepID=A0ABQ7AI40_BRACR|nr:hypothetical protein DY000_02058140 [Brassica cretica]
MKEALNLKLPQGEESYKLVSPERERETRASSSSSSSWRTVKILSEELRILIEEERLVFSVSHTHEAKSSMAEDSPPLPAIDLFLRPAYPRLESAPEHHSRWSERIDRRVIQLSFIMHCSLAATVFMQRYKTNDLHLRLNAIEHEGGVGLKGPRHILLKVKDAEFNEDSAVIQNEKAVYFPKTDGNDFKFREESQRRTEISDGKVCVLSN